MGSFLATCPIHGGFTVNNLIGGDGPFFMAGISTSCPRCGRPSPIHDGEYEMRDSVGLPTIYRPTPAQAFKLSQTLRWATVEMQKAAPDTDKAARILEATVRQNAPEVANWLHRLRDQFKSNPAGWIGLLIAVFSLIVAAQPQQGITADQFEKILHEVGQQVQLEQANLETEVPTLPQPAPLPPEGSPTVTELPTPTTR